MSRDLDWSDVQADADRAKQDEFDRGLRYFHSVDAYVAVWETGFRPTRLLVVDGRSWLIGLDPIEGDGWYAYADQHTAINYGVVALVAADLPELILNIRSFN